VFTLLSGTQVQCLRNEAVRGPAAQPAGSRSHGPIVIHGEPVPSSPPAVSKLVVRTLELLAARGAAERPGPAAAGHGELAAEDGEAAAAAAALLPGEEERLGGHGLRRVREAGEGGVPDAAALLRRRVAQGEGLLLAGHPWRERLVPVGDGPAVVHVHVHTHRVLGVPRGQLPGAGRTVKLMRFC
jgi:hypothetical protein